MSKFDMIVELMVKNGVTTKFSENLFKNLVNDEPIIELDFTEHDKPFNDKIETYKKECVRLQDRLAQTEKDYQEEVKVLYQRIAELESKETEKSTKLNLNDRVKVKLTPLGAEIYYHQYDEVNKRIKENGGTELEPIMPQIDKERYTEFQLWHFMELYGEHIGMCKPNVINPLDIVFVE